MGVEVAIPGGFVSMFPGIFWTKKIETPEPVEKKEKTFYCGNCILLAGFSPQKISENLFWRQISPGRMSGTIRSHVSLVGSDCKSRVALRYFSQFISSYKAL